MAWIFRRRLSSTVPSFSFSVRRSAYPIQEFVVDTSKRQKPGIAVVEAERRAGEGSSDKRIFRSLACYQFRDFLSLPAGHGDTVAGVAQSVIDPIRSEEHTSELQ